VLGIVTAQRSHLGEISLRLFFQAELFEKGIGLIRPPSLKSYGGLKFRSLEMSDKRFPPLDYGTVTSGFIFLKPP
jgi:hypothetical protein